MRAHTHAGRHACMQCAVRGFDSGAQPERKEGGESVRVSVRVEVIANLDPRFRQFNLGGQTLAGKDVRVVRPLELCSANRQSSSLSVVAMREAVARRQSVR